MLDKKTIENLMLLPEVDLEKATKLQFTNSDKLAGDAILGTNPEVSKAAFLASQIAVQDIQNIAGAGL